MAYISLNDNLPNIRESGISKRIREEKLELGNRFEFKKGMYGNVHSIVDHERKVYYRQDRPIKEQLNLLDDALPRYCDYCNTQCDNITLINYKLVYEMIVRPKTRPTLKRDEQSVVYASCGDCGKRVNEIPEHFLSGYIKEIHKNGKLIWECFAS